MILQENKAANYFTFIQCQVTGLDFYLFVCWFLFVCLFVSYHLPNKEVIY